MYDAIDGIIKCMGFLLLLMVIGGICGIYDLAVKEPKAAEKANDYCVAHGFDQYKSFKRIGIFSENPVGIKCEYAERYTDLGVRVNE